MLTYSRPPYRCDLKPPHLGALMMITRAPESRSDAPSWTDLSVACLYVAVVPMLEWL